MAYYRKGIRTKIFVQPNNYHDLYVWSKSHSDFERLTFDYMWKSYSHLSGSNSKYIEPTEVPEFESLFVPRILFDTLGVNTLFKKVFPNCEIQYWEDDSPV